MNNNQNSSSSSASSSFSSSFGLSLVGLNNLVTIPCMSACLSLFCSLALITRCGSDNISHNNNSSSPAVEALLSVALAYSACSFEAKRYNHASTTTTSDSNNRRDQELSRKEQARAALTSKILKRTNLHSNNTGEGEDEEEHFQDSTQDSENSFAQDISAWNAMSQGERSALTLRFFLLSLCTQWIACYPVKNLQKEIPRHVISTLPGELRSVLELKFNPTNKVLLNKMAVSGDLGGLRKGNEEMNDEKNAAAPKIFSFNNAAKLRQQQSMQQQQKSNLGDDENGEKESYRKKDRASETQRQLLMLWAELESCAGSNVF